MARFSFIVFSKGFTMNENELRTGSPELLFVENPGNFDE